MTRDSQKWISGHDFKSGCWTGRFCLASFPWRRQPTSRYLSFFFPTRICWNLELQACANSISTKKGFFVTLCFLPMKPQSTIKLTKSSNFLKPNRFQSPLSASPRVSHNECSILSSSLVSRMMNWLWSLCRWWMLGIIVIVVWPVDDGWWFLLWISFWGSLSWSFANEIELWNTIVETCFHDAVSSIRKHSHRFLSRFHVRLSEQFSERFSEGWWAMAMAGSRWC
jgi:hypothetical protein